MYLRASYIKNALFQVNNSMHLCVTFGMLRLFDVGKNQPVPIVVYDLTKPLKKSRIFYNLGKNSRTMRRCQGSLCSCTQGMAAYLLKKYGNCLSQCVFFQYYFESFMFYANVVKALGLNIDQTTSSQKQYQVLWSSQRLRNKYKGNNPFLLF